MGFTKVENVWTTGGIGGGAAGVAKMTMKLAQVG